MANLKLLVFDHGNSADGVGGLFILEGSSNCAVWNGPVDSSRRQGVAWMMLGVTEWLSLL
jgi:hypothetical protein